MKPKITVKPVQLTKLEKCEREHLDVHDQWIAHIGKRPFANVFYTEKLHYWFEAIYFDALMQITPERPSTYYSLEGVERAINKALEKVYSGTIELLEVKV